MRTRQKFTAVGAFTLAAGSIGSGALVTSSAMADEPTPDKGTITVVSMQAGADEAITCTFENVDLPTLTFAAGTEGEEGTIVSAGVEIGEPPEGGTVFSTRVPGDLASPPPAGGQIVLGQAGELTSAGSALSVEVAPPEGGAPPMFVFDDGDARPGTPDECAALEADLPGPGLSASAPVSALPSP